MAITSRALYLYTVNDVPGFVAAHTFLSIFNPLGSGVSHVVQSIIVSSYAVNATSAAKSLTAWRITAHSLGVSVGGALVPRHQTNWSDPLSQVRITGPTTVPAVGVGPVILAFPPAIAGSSGASNSIASTPPAATFIALPGEGFAFGTAAGDVDQAWNITYIWQEIT